MNHVQIFLWWWWADINGTLGSVGCEIERSQIPGIWNYFDPNNHSRWPQVRVSNMQTNSAELLIATHLYILLFLVRQWLHISAGAKPLVCIFSFQWSIWCSFSLQKLRLWFGCHSFIRVRSMSVASPSIPPLLLLNESCGSLALARSRASSSTLYWPAYNSLRLISACLTLSS